jgi:predicted O-linked N-acetylglucosamine transferase (SPINDLY family)
MRRDGLDREILSVLNLHERVDVAHEDRSRDRWAKFVRKLTSPHPRTLNLGITGKYAHLRDAYASIDKAIEHYNKALELKPDYDYLLGIRLHLKMYLCDWQDFERDVSELSLKTQRNAKASPCLPLLALPIGLTEQRKAAEIWCADKYPFNPSLGPIIKSARKSKIRIGYYSADFHTHPVSILSVGLFEHHDKSKFELIAFSFGPETQDEIRGRIKNAFDKFIDVSSMSDKKVAALSRELGVDIAIDLGGYTHNCRTGIFSFRAAPIQLSYIGYLGTMGAEYYDYLIADKVVIPENSQKYYCWRWTYWLPCIQ